MCVLPFPFLLVRSRSPSCPVSASAIHRFCVLSWCTCSLNRVVCVGGTHRRITPFGYCADFLEDFYVNRDIYIWAKRGCYACVGFCYNAMLDLGGCSNFNSVYLVDLKLLRLWSKWRCCVSNVRGEFDFGFSLSVSEECPLSPCHLSLAQLLYVTLRLCLVVSPCSAGMLCVC